MTASPTATGPRLALLGAGRMGQAILAGLLGAGWDPARIVVAEPDHDAAARAEAHGVTVLPPQRAVVGADAVVVAVKPAMVGALLDQVSARLAAGTVVISVAAGLTTTTLAEHLPAGTAVVRVMPNMPALIGQGMSGLSPAHGCPDAARDLAVEVMAAVGEVRVVDEALQDAVTAVSGSGPAYVFHVVEAMIDAGVLLGLPRGLAHDLTVQTLVGSAAMLRDTQRHPALLREDVTSPGGTTAEALHVLEAAGVKAAFAEAMRACRDRSAELSGS